MTTLEHAKNYAQTLQGSTAYREAMLNSKFGFELGIIKCSDIAKMTYKEVDKASIEFDRNTNGQGRVSYDPCDLFICYAEYLDGTPLTDNEMDILNPQDYI